MGRQRRGDDRSEENNGGVSLISVGKGSVAVYGGASGWTSMRGGQIHVRDFINVSKFDGNDYRAVELSITEHGGNVAVFGKGSKQARATMVVNEYGNGAVSTWNKTGYRLATLK